MIKPEDNGPHAEDRPVAVEIRAGMLRVTLKDTRVISTPLQWYPQLAAATEAQLANVELSAYGIHWPDLDEDLSVGGMLKGLRPPHPRKGIRRES